jgi:hypothetical protein
VSAVAGITLRSCGRPAAAPSSAGLHPSSPARLSQTGRRGREFTRGTGHFSGVTAQTRKQLIWLI